MIYIAFSQKFKKYAIAVIILAAIFTSCKRQADDPSNTKAVETNATFPGGIDSFYAYLASNIHYPLAARQNNVQGKVYITFIIDTDGSVTDVKVLKGIGSGCDEEAVRVIKASPKWTPGMQNGRAVRQQFTVPINFTLVDDIQGNKQGIITVD